jgi:hypothetical protein
VRSAPRRVRTFAKTVSEALLFKDNSLSISDIEVKAEDPDEDAMVDELSMDELLADTVRSVVQKTSNKAIQLNISTGYFG